MYKKRLERQMELARRSVHSQLEARVYTWREGTPTMYRFLVLFRHTYILKLKLEVRADNDPSWMHRSGSVIEISVLKLLIFWC